MSGEYCSIFNVYLQLSDPIGEGRYVSLIY